MDPASSDPLKADGPDIIAARVDRAALAQGHGADLGLYAATPGAFPAIMATNAGLALLPMAVSGQNFGADAFSYRADIAASAASSPAPLPSGAEAPSLTSSLDAGQSFVTAPMLAMATYTPDMVESSGFAAAPNSNEQMLVGLDAQGMLATSATAQAAPAALATQAAAADTVTNSLTGSLAAPVLAPILAPVQQAVDVLGAQNAATLAAALHTTEALLSSVEELAAGQIVTLGNTLDAVADRVDSVLDRVGSIDLPSALGTIAPLELPQIDIPGTLDSVADLDVPALIDNVAALDTLRALDTVETLGASAVQLTPGTMDNLATTVEAVDDTLGTVSAPVASLTAPVADTLAAAEGAVETLAPPVADLTAPVVDTLDDLTGLAGADPAAGISTLTSLISAADVFAVSDEASPDLGLADGIGAGGMLDMLAPPAVEAVLLGGDDPLHDTLSHLDDLHLGLG